MVPGHHWYMAGLFAMVGRVILVTVCHVRMMTSLLVVSGVMVFGGCEVMLSGLFVMFRSLAMMF